MTHCYRRPLCVVALMLGIAAPTRAMSYGDITFEPCRLPTPPGQHSPAAFCADVQVPEDWQQPAGKQITLAIAWLPAHSRTPAPAPLVMLAGGPGQAARTAFVPLLPAYRPLREQHHLFLIDQRGTGASAPIRCPPLVDDDELGAEAHQKLHDWAQACVARHAASHDLSHYHTSAAVMDLEAVRQALGLAAWHVLGVSYGTRVAQRYAQRFPAAVRTLVLDGVVPEDVLLGADDGVNLDRAMQAQLARCAADADCHAVFPAPYDDLKELSESLEKTPQSVHLRHPRTGKSQDRRLTRSMLSSWARVMAYTPELIPLLPWTLQQARLGDPAPLAAQAWMLEEMLSQQLSMGMQLSVLCNEPVPPLSPDPPAKDATSQLLRPSHRRNLYELCTFWPKSRHTQSTPTHTQVHTPALLLSGEFDPVTPPAYGVRAMGHFKRARHFILQGQSHGVSAVGCAPLLIADFLSHARPEDLEPSCLERLAAPPFFLHAQGTAP